MRALATLLILSSAMLAGCGGGGSSTGPSTLSVTAPMVTIPSGTSVQATATITNGSGTSPAPNVTWSSADHFVVSVSSTGLLTAAKKGSTTIKATSGTLSAELNVAVIPGQPASIVIVSGNGQTGAHGSTLADPLCTAVLDAAGNFIVGVTVTYTVASGGGVIAAPTAPATDAAGIAISGHWTLGPGTGQQSVTATASVGSTTFTATSQ
ncbi:MAG TPA: Ig-like domain-containing protein [Gemmatimonadaceae bacterium]|nr:Ig-like domain-containing protein [Gemmatimonadaceae bacterium]